MPRKHAQLIAPHIHPALEQKSFVLYMMRAFVLQPKRVRYDGAVLALADEGPDGDWIGGGPDLRPQTVLAPSE